jgi:hypothetical protein
LFATKNIVITRSSGLMYRAAVFLPRLLDGAQVLVKHPV